MASTSPPVSAAGPVPAAAAVPLFPLLRERLWPEKRARGPAGGIWVHAVSVGEVEVAATLVQEISRLRPGLSLLVSSTTPAGVALAARRFAGGPARSRPFPLDLPFSVRRFFDSERPGLLVLVETELWPGVLAEAARRGTPVLLVNARLSKRSAARYLALRPVLGRRLAAVTHVLARSSRDAERFAAIGIPKERISRGGDMKLDRALPPEPSFAESFRRLAAGRPVLVAGSFADEEVALALDVRRSLVEAKRDPFLLLAPRRPESFGEIASALVARDLSVVRRSAIADVGPLRPAVFLLDSIGELAAAYRLGDVAFLGGTFAPRGGHNVLEPLRAGLPVVHGPSVWNIREALDAAAGAVWEAADGPAAAVLVERLLSERALRTQAASVASRLFEAHAGATRTAAEKALELLR